MGRRAKAGCAGSRGGSSRGGARRGGADRRKKRGEYTGEDFDSLVAQLRPLGLYVRKMDPDGNCLFRAFADQICGDCEEHQQFRDECCNILEESREDFELFHADDADDADEEGLSFDAYVENMRSPGCWGSQLELIALCQRYELNARVHQSGQLPWDMVKAGQDARCIQVSYHDGEHFNSVRFSWDLVSGQPAHNYSLLQLQGNVDAEDAEGAEVRQVRELLPPEHQACVAAIREALARAGGDASAAAERLLMEDVGAAPAEGRRGAEARSASEDLVCSLASSSTKTSVLRKQAVALGAGEAEMEEAEAADDSKAALVDLISSLKDAKASTSSAREWKALRRKAKEAAEQRRRAATG